LACTLRRARRLRRLGNRQALLKADDQLLVTWRSTANELLITDLLIKNGDTNWIIDKYIDDQSKSIPPDPGDATRQAPLGG